MFSSPLGACNCCQVDITKKKASLVSIPRFLQASHRRLLLHRFESRASSEYPESGFNRESPTEIQRNEEEVEQGEEEEEEVREALQKVHEAIAAAELTVEKIDSLPSARLPTVYDKVKEMLRPVAKVCLLIGFCRAMHSVNVVSQVAGGLFLACTVALRGYRNNSLSPSGAIAAAAVGWSTLSSSFRAGLVLLGFFFASSALTKFGDENKDIEEDHKKGGQRNWIQVLSNGGIPALLAIAGCLLSGGIDLPVIPFSSMQAYSIVTTAFLGYYSCCCGDTWSSEIGQLSEEEPRLITTLRPVRKGTNGGCTLLGLASSCLGGLYIGLLFFITGVLSPQSSFANSLSQVKLIPLSIGAGLIGSLIDSILGATIQFTGYNRETGKITGKSGPNVSRISGVPILDNNGVNVMSATLTACLTASCAAIM